MESALVRVGEEVGLLLGRGLEDDGPDDFRLVAALRDLRGIVTCLCLVRKGPPAAGLVAGDLDPDLAPSSDPLGSGATTSPWPSSAVERPSNAVSGGGATASTPASEAVGSSSSSPPHAPTDMAVTATKKRINVWRVRFTPAYQRAAPRLASPDQDDELRGAGSYARSRVSRRKGLAMSKPMFDAD
jgi:hypothetical protein